MSAITFLFSVLKRILTTCQGNVAICLMHALFDLVIATSYNIYSIGQESLITS